MVLPLLIGIALVIAAAKLGAAIAQRLGQPAVLGSLFAGILIGPSALGVFTLPYFDSAHTASTLHELGELGVILLMFSAGLETHLDEMLRSGKAAVLGGMFGVLLPIVFGALTTLLFGYGLTEAIFMGLILGATSVSISAQTLMELGKLRTREGLTMLGAAVVDDVLALVLVSVFLALNIEGGEQSSGLAWTLIRMLLVLAGSLLLALYGLPKLGGWSEKLPISEPIMSVALVTLLIFAWSAEALGGVAAITGAFIAGLGFGRSTVHEEINRDLRAMAYALLVPVFLVGIGLQVDLRSMSLSDWLLGGVISLVAILSKMIGSGLGALWGGLTRGESLRVGVAMVSRGEVGLIIAGIGVNAGLIPANAFTIAVAMVLITTFFSPTVLPVLFRRTESPRREHRRDTPPASPESEAGPAESE